jgi:hypothetical protein
MTDRPLNRYIYWESRKKDPGTQTKDGRTVALACGTARSALNNNMSRTNPMLTAALTMRRVALHRPIHRHPSPSPTSSTRCRRRTIVTSSTSPSPDVFIERPEVVVLCESSFYHYGNNSWHDHSMSYFPKCGLQYASIDVFRSTTTSRRPRDSDAAPHPHPTLDDLERTMAEDLSRLIVIDDVYDEDDVIGDATTTSDSAHVVLIARGPIQCLVAQYFLER